MLKIALLGLYISKFSGGSMPPNPPRGSRLRRSYLITPLNKYSCQYEHSSKNLSYAPEHILLTKMSDMTPRFEAILASFSRDKYNGQVPASFPDVSLFLRDKSAQRTKCPSRFKLVTSRTCFALALLRWPIEASEEEAGQVQV